jgi:transcriptional regulator with XRE-family HTH domain
LRKRLRAAFDESGLTVAELRDRSGLDLDPSSLSRKLGGRQSLRAEEAEAIANALGCSIELREKRAAA